MLPLLAIYADLVGVLGGAVVGIALLDITPTQYYGETIAALNLRHFAVGLVQAAVFGVLIAVAGCMRGMQSGRSASAVGDAATSAVVTSIVLIVVSLSIFTIVFDALGI
jgi:phospholipid/cholesterol/gamma-HCH transport system permease protein